MMRKSLPALLLLLVLASGQASARAADCELETCGLVKVLKELPMEFAVEAQKLLQISLEGSVG